MQKKVLRVDFTDFWPGFDKTNNFFYNLLSEKYDVAISDNPDILIYSVYTNNHTKYNCTRVLFTGENVKPNFTECDYAFTFERETNAKNYRLPLYALYHDVINLVNRPVDTDVILNAKTKFCCFLVSNDKCTTRNDFFHQLSKYKQVDSGGRTLNNIGYQVADKHDFIKDYKFVIAFENESHPGYTTEKVYEPLIANCIPIYWGNPFVYEDFNTKSFINCHEFSSFDEVITHIIRVDDDDELYKQYLREPVFNSDQLTDFVKKENIVRRLDEIVDFHFNKKLKVYKTIRPAYFRIVAVSKYTRSKFLWVPNKWRILKSLINKKSQGK